MKRKTKTPFPGLVHKVLQPISPLLCQIHCSILAQIQGHQLNLLMLKLLPRVGSLPLYIRFIYITNVVWYIGSVTEQGPNSRLIITHFRMYQEASWLLRLPSLLINILRLSLDPSELMDFIIDQEFMTLVCKMNIQAWSSPSVKHSINYFRTLPSIYILVLLNFALQLGNTFSPLLSFILKLQLPWE